MRWQSRLFFRFGKPACHLSPVNEVPERGDVVWATILVVQVVGVFPDVESQQWGPTFHQGAILIRGAFNNQLSLVIGEPRPTTPKSSGRRRTDFFFQCRKASKGAVDRSGQFASRFGTGMRSQNRPEQGMVCMATRVVADQRAVFFGDRS